jgi:hypothetical protein
MVWYLVKCRVFLALRTMILVDMEVVLNGMCNEHISAVSSSCQ